MTPDRLLDVVRTVADSLGFDLVDVRQQGTPSRPIVKVRAELVGAAAGTTTDDCARLSRALEQALEGSGAVGAAYVLEVSSPGIERPVRFLEHWRRYVGRRVSLKAPGIAGRQVAVVEAVPDDDTVEVRLADGQLVRVPLTDVKDAVLVYDWPAAGRKTKH